MALIDIVCKSCDTISEVYRRAVDHPWTPSCPKCDAPDTEQIHLPRGTYAHAPAVVVYQAPDGTFRFPGETDGSSTAKYDRMGYTRVEARGWAEVRSLEGRLNSQQSSEMRRRVERECQFREEAMKARRSEVYNGLTNSFSIPEVVAAPNGNAVRTGRMIAVKLGPEARDLMRTAMDRNDRKPTVRFREPGMVVEAYSYDRGNREESRGADGRRRRD